MKKLLKIIKRLVNLEAEAGRRFLGTYPTCQPLLDLCSDYRAAMSLLCSLIKKSDLKSLSWLELHILVDATDPKDKLRRWVFDLQRTFPAEITEAQHKKQVSDFNAFYAQSLM